MFFTGVKTTLQIGKEHVLWHRTLSPVIFKNVRWIMATNAVCMLHLKMLEFLRGLKKGL